MRLGHAANIVATRDENGAPAWLKARRLRRLDAWMDALDRTGAKVGRVTTILTLGFVGAAALPGLALAPISQAQASVERFLTLPPAVPVLIEIGVNESAAERRQATLDETRVEIDEFLRFGSREVPRRIVDTIVRAASTTGVDAIYLMALADKESSFRPDVKASTSSAEGLFQFIDRTWLMSVRRFGGLHGLDMEADAISIEGAQPVVEDEAMRVRILQLRRDPYISAVMAAELLKGDARQIGSRVGRELNHTEMYLTHFLGLENAARFIEMRARKRPANAVRTFPSAARANAAIFYERKKRGRRGLSVPEVYARIDGMIDTRLTRYRGVEVYAAVEPRP